MKIVAAYLLAALGGKSNPSVDDVKSILSSVGIEADEDMLQLFFDQVSGKDVTELVATGREKLASVPSGGGAIAVAAAPAGGEGAAAAAEQPKEEKVEDKEESDDDIGMGLFDD